MFWKKKSSGTSEPEKMPGPQPISESVGKVISEKWGIDPDVARLLKSVISRNGNSKTSIRIFDESDCLANGVQIKNYATFDPHPELVVFEGSLDETTKQTDLVEKKKDHLKITLLNEKEILDKIEALAQPGSTVFFYQAQGSQHGGPLGMGANIIELNPTYPEKGKKYNVYSADVVNGQPVRVGSKMFDSNKSRELAKWVQTGHHKRWYS